MSYIQIFCCVEGQCPNLCLVQGSTVYIDDLEGPEAEGHTSPALQIKDLMPVILGADRSGICVLCQHIYRQLSSISLGQGVGGEKNLPISNLTSTKTSRKSLVLILHKCLSIACRNTTKNLLICPLY